MTFIILWSGERCSQVSPPHLLLEASGLGNLTRKVLMKIKMIINDDIVEDDTEKQRNIEDSY